MKEKAYKITLRELKKENFRYLPMSYIVSIYDRLVCGYGLSHSNETIRGMQEALENFFWGNIEPEWVSMEEEKWWNGMNVDYFCVHPSGSFRNNRMVYDWQVEIPKQIIQYYL